VGRDPNANEHPQQTDKSKMLITQVEIKVRPANELKARKRKAKNWLNRRPPINVTVCLMEIEFLAIAGGLRFMPNVCELSSSMQWEISINEKKRFPKN